MVAFLFSPWNGNEPVSISYWGGGGEEEEEEVSDFTARLLEQSLHVHIHTPSALERTHTRAVATVLTMRTPKDHQSAVVPCPLRLTTSGAMYSTVPQNEYVFLSSTASLLRPKSGGGGGGESNIRDRV